MTIRVIRTVVTMGQPEREVDVIPPEPDAQLIQVQWPEKWEGGTRSTAVFTWAVEL